MKTIREIAVADRLWELLGQLAADLGADREALVHQALHALLRFHGVLPAADGADPTQAGSAPPARQAVARKVLDTARELERAITAEGAPGEAGEGVLSLQRGDGAPARVERDRFVIGRGRHCDLVIDSAKVSREHAVIRREVDGWWIEDLGSSNGTWFKQARIDRRRIADGDEYYVSAERIRCVLS